ncbi:iron ABC transporter permease [Halobacillus fulvus]|nr:iron ABC transporter permease [Halobacillus fulvus]
MGEYIHVRTKSGRLSFQVRKKSIFLLIGLAILTMAVFLISLASGSNYIPVQDVIAVLIGISEDHAFVLNELRMPRVLMGFMVGASLGVAGLILQGVIRNPLASPDIIGVTGGASVGAILFLSFLAGTVSVVWLPLAAILGAFVATTLIYSLSWKNGVTPIRLILIGIGISALMNAVVTMLIVLSDTTVTTRSYLWLTGSLYGSNWEEIGLMIPWVLVLLPIALLFSNIVNVKELGDDVASGLGIHVQKYRFILIAVSVALAGAAVAFAGGIGFIGLIAPHITRLILERSFAILVIGSALIGGMMVLIADIVARTAFLPLDIPAGVFTAGIGAPFFIYLLYRNRQVTSG